MGIGSGKMSTATYPLFFFFVLLRTTTAKIASISYVPQGSNPLLYQPGNDPIMFVFFKNNFFGFLSFLDIWIKTLFLTLFLSQAEEILL